MFFGSDDDDGGAFSIGMPKGSNLGSLFGGPQVPSGNDSLMYTPQKQPSKNKEPVKESKPPPGTPQLLFATVCHAFKYINGQYAPQGKLGAAVLGHFENKDYKILLYQSQKKPVTNARIHQNFKFDVQKNNYTTFYDDQSQNWSVCFDNEGQQAEFAKWVGLSRFNVTPNLTLQDLNVIDGQEVQKGDTVEMQYTGWLHAGNAFGKVFDSNKDTGKLLKFKVGKGKVIKGWETGVIGMKKGLKRLLVIPADQAYGATAVSDKVPANSILIFHVELTRVKFVNPQAEPDTVSLTSVNENKENIKVETQPKDEIDGNPDEDAIHVMERTKSISEQLSKTPDTKSKLLERMSKMGQAIILTPNVQKSDEDTAHSDEINKPSIERHPSNESNRSADSPRPNLKPKPDAHPRTHQEQHPPQQQVHQQQPQQQPVQQHQQQIFPQQQQPMYGNQAMYQQTPPQHIHQMDPSFYFQQPQQQLALYQSPQAVQHSLFGMNPTLAQQTVQQQQAAGGVSSTEINLLMTDGKVKHNELKNDLIRLIEKVDVISTKVISIENSNKQMQVAMPQQAAEMEAAVLMENITRIIKENAKLQTECEEKSKKIEKLNESMTDLLTKNQSFFEKSNQLLANQSDSMQNNAAQAMAKVSVLEQRTIQLEANLSTCRTQLLHAQKKEEAYGSHSAELTVQIETLQKQVKQYKEQIDSSSSSTNEHEDEVKELKQQVKAAKKEHKQLSVKLEQSEEECSEAKQEVETFTKNLADMKKKRKEEKAKHDEEQEELRTQHEGELRNLKQRYGKSASSDSEKLNKLEEELTSKFDEKMKKKLKAMESEYKEKTDEMQTENENLKHNLKSTQKQLKNIAETLSTEYDEKLQARLSKANEKHEVNLEEVNKETTKLKQALDALENKIKADALEPNEVLSAELQVLRAKQNIHQEERKKLQDDVHKTREELINAQEELTNKNEEFKKLQTDCAVAYDRGVEEGRSMLKTISQASYERGLKEGKSAGNEGGSVDQASVQARVTDEVKKVMNSVFFKLKSEFDIEENYDGKEVIGTILNVVREVTLKLVQKPAEEDAEDDGDEDDVDEEEEEEEEEEESQEDSEEENRAENTKEKVSTGELGEQQEKLPWHPPEETTVTKENQGLDVTSMSSFDEVDVTTNKEGENLPEVEVTTVSIENTKEITVPSDPLSTDKHLKSADETSDEDDDDNISFSSATFEPVQEESTEPKIQVTTHVEAIEENNTENVQDDVENDTISVESTEKESEANIPKNALTEIGLDSSIFGTSESEDIPDEVDNKQTIAEDTEDESSLFFGAATSTIATKVAIDTTTANKSNKNKLDENDSPKSALSLFDDEDDEDDFFTKKTAKKQPSAFNRDPPPLFDDDDDETNWI